MTATKNVSPKKNSASPPARRPVIRFRWARLRSIGVFYHKTNQRPVVSPWGGYWFLGRTSRRIRR